MLWCFNKLYSSLFNYYSGLQKGGKKLYSQSVFHYFKILAFKPPECTRMHLRAVKFSKLVLGHAVGAPHGRDGAPYGRDGAPYGRDSAHWSPPALLIVDCNFLSKGKPCLCMIFEPLTFILNHFSLLWIFYNR